MACYLYPSLVSLAMVRRYARILFKEKDEEGASCVGAEVSNCEWHWRLRASAPIEVHRDLGRGTRRDERSKCCSSPPTGSRRWPAWGDPTDWHVGILCRNAFSIPCQSGTPHGSYCFSLSVTILETLGKNVGGRGVMGLAPGQMELR